MHGGNSDFRRIYSAFFSSNGSEMDMLREVETLDHIVGNGSCVLFLPEPIESPFVGSFREIRVARSRMNGGSIEITEGQCNQGIYQYAEIAQSQILSGRKIQGPNPIQITQEMVEKGLVYLVKNSGE